MPRVRFIDPLFVTGNPSTNGLVSVAARLASEGWEVEVCSHSLDPSLTGLVAHNRMRDFRQPFGLSVWAYFILYHCQRLKEIVQRAKRPDVIVSTGFL